MKIRNTGLNLFSVKWSRGEDRYEEYHVAPNLRSVLDEISIDIDDEAIIIEAITRHVPILSITTNSTNTNNEIQS